MTSFCVYGSSHCVFTQMAVKLLAKRRANYRFVDVTPIQRQCLERSTHQKTIPYVFSGPDGGRGASNFIGGYAELARIL